MTIKLTPAQAKTMGVDVKTKTRTTRTTARGAHHTICTACLMEFHTVAAEDRHVAPGHNRFELVLELQP